ncbi:MAG: hypothetical protein BGO67_06130 [Alphaproteobacteria bacterium 41-28]|nr:MAG: hypothetical protein BGO67_06130 [Alphaproteobacteria bacterium 41-28]
MRSMAIKINVSPKDQEAINDALEKVGYPRQRRKYHCTFGFIEKMVPEEESTAFGEKIIHMLQDYINPLSPHYEVEKAAHLFGHVIAFLPTDKSLATLREINLWLSDKVKDISEGRWELNTETQSQTYIPHLTLWRTRHPDHRFDGLKVAAEMHPSYHLSNAGYVIF